jgi:hypothetical protein
MKTAHLYPSPFAGRRVVYVDSLRITHAGEIVGQTPSGSHVYVRSDLPTAPAQAWHFKVSRVLLPAVLVKNPA